MSYFITYEIIQPAPWFITLYKFTNILSVSLKGSYSYICVPRFGLYAMVCGDVGDSLDRHTAAKFIGLRKSSIVNRIFDI